MQAVSFKRHRFPPDVIRQAVWLYFRFTLSLRDVEEMLAERGVETNYETIRCWAQIWTALRPEPTPIQTTANRPLALGRDGREDLGKADVALAGSR